MYKFPLQRLLDLKAKKEQEMARQLAGARLTADAERDTRDTLAATHADAQHHIAMTASGANEASDGTGTPTVGELASMSFALEQLGERVSAADERALAADQVVNERHEHLSVAVRDRQVLDRLRGKRLELHNSEESARDRQLMDAIALVRFASSRAKRGRET